MSPIGEAFRTRLRMFPALVNCCSIDWFRAWPPDALDAVASTFLEEVEMEKHNRQSTVEMCKIFHEGVRVCPVQVPRAGAAERVRDADEYLELIQTFQTLLAQKRREIGQLRRRYDNGLTQLEAAGKAVTRCRRSSPRSSRSSCSRRRRPRRCGGSRPMQRCSQDRQGGEGGRRAQEGGRLQSEEKVANEVAAMRVKGIKDECEADLAEAIPALNSALAALDTIKKADIDLVKGMGNPPAGIKLVLEAVMRDADVKPEKVKDPDGHQEGTDDYFGPAKKMMMDAKEFVDALKTYDKDNIHPKIIKVIRDKYIPMEDFTPENAKKASSAAEGMCKWIIAMEIYDRVAKVVAPKKAVAREGRGRVRRGDEGSRGEAGRAQGRARQARRRCKTKLAELADKKKDELEDQYEDCNNKLERAEKLMGRPRRRARPLGRDLEEARPQVHQPARRRACWRGRDRVPRAVHDPVPQGGDRDVAGALRSRSASRVEKFSLQEIVGDPVKIRAWNIQGSPPTPSRSTIIITSVARRWPTDDRPAGAGDRLPLPPPPPPPPPRATTTAT